jgi:Ca-activated chloride channel family protein
MVTMHLTQPHWLWLLLVIPTWLFWHWWRRRRTAIHFSDTSWLGSLPAGRTRWVESLRVFCRIVVLASLIIALARPRWPDEQTRIPAQSTAIQIVLDVSGSMGEQDFLQDSKRVSRLQASQRVLRLLIQGDSVAFSGRTDDLVGLLTFAVHSEQVCPPTLSHTVVLQLLDEAKPLGTPPESSTNIGDAMIEGLGLLHRAKPREKIVILISDGEHNVPHDIVPNAAKPRQAGQLAKSLAVRVYTIYVGPKVNSSKQPADVAGEQALSDVAAMTGGRSFSAHDIDALLEVCRQIDTFERTRVESFQYYRYHELYPLLGMTAVIFLLFGFALEGARWLRVP